MSGPRRAGVISVLRDWLSSVVGVTPESRVQSARAMLDRHGTDRFGYWLQLVLSMGIATYGLVLGSTGVVIGAMLVSPLMAPLVEIGMGLVVGSALLVVHAAVRTAFSIAVVVGLSALLTVSLPYHEVTAEIAARTSPTLLDLYVACFCALAAAYTTVRRSSDTVTAAAGTAISIALVPPLCVVGWGIGSRNPHVWRGAALLFTANFCAIVLFSVVVFVVLAFDTVDLSALERTDGSTMTDRVALRVHRFFGARWGSALRLLMPLALAAAVFVPLRHALDEVAWTVRTRAEVQKVLESLPPTKRALRSSVSVERHAVSVRLVVLGDSKTAEGLKRDLEAKLAAASGVVPTIDVFAIPDEEALKLATQPVAPPHPIVVPAKPSLAQTEQAIDDELRSSWPADAAGELRAWRLDAHPGAPLVVVVVHFGQALGPAGEKLLASSLARRVEVEVAVRDLALSESRAAAAPDRWLGWLPSLTEAVEKAATSGVAHVCVTSASGSMKGAAREQALIVDEQVKQLLSRIPPDRASLRQAEEWSVALSAAECALATTSADAGTD